MNMMKTKGFIALIITLACCLTLSGCVDVDELRKTHGIWVEEGENTILMDGKVYRRLMFNDRLIIDVKYKTMEYGYVTDANVPVLLKEAYGEYFRISEDDVYLCMDVDNDGDNEYFCLEEKVEEITEKLEDTSIMKNYYYKYTEKDKWVESRYVLSSEEVTAIADCITQGGNLRVIPFDDGLTYDYYVRLYRCDDSEVFSEFVCGIMAYENRYYVCQYTVEETSIYEVDEEDFPIFGAMLSKYTENELDWETT